MKDKLNNVDSNKYFNKINYLINCILECERLKMFTCDEYNELMEILSIEECGKSYSDVDYSHKYWLNSFLCYDNYYLWIKTRPLASPKETGDALRLLANKLSK